MKITLLADVDGAVYVATPTPDVDAERRIRVGHIASVGKGYGVFFQVSCLSKFDKSDFSSRESAILYEQEILNENLGDILKELFNKE